MSLLLDTACMSTEMSFKELFEHLSIYMCDPEQRWKHVVRAKRCLPDCGQIGGCGYDQCYFEGWSYAKTKNNVSWETPSYAQITFP